MAKTKAVKVKRAAAGNGRPREDGRIQMPLRVPRPLRDAIATEAFTSGRNMNDVAVGILAERFGVPFTPSGRSSVPSGPAS